MIQTQENGKKPHFTPDLGPLACQNFFQNMALSVIKYHDHLSLCKTSEKTNDPIFMDR